MVCIRVDMNEQIATGHMMRCLSIADALRDLGEQVTFILADEQAINLLKQRGYDAIVLHTQWNDMDGELQGLSQMIQNEQIEKLLIDSYLVTPQYLAKLSESVKTVYIDDMLFVFFVFLFNELFGTEEVDKFVFLIRLLHDTL